MDLKNAVLAKVRKWGKGQTMTEYSLIVLFVGVAAYSAYAELGLGVKAFADSLITFVTTAAAAL